jgi:hypothetical protein
MHLARNEWGYFSHFTPWLCLSLSFPSTPNILSVPSREKEASGGRSPRPPRIDGDAEAGGGEYRCGAALDLGSSSDRASTMVARLRQKGKPPP